MSDSLWKQSNVRKDISKSELVSSVSEHWVVKKKWNWGLIVNHATGEKLTRHKKRKGKTTPVVLFGMCVHGRCLSISSSYLLLRWWLILEDILIWSKQQKCNIVTDTSCMVPSPHSWCPRGGHYGLEYNLKSVPWYLVTSNPPESWPFLWLKLRIVTSFL